MRIRDMEYVLEVAKNGSISATAKKLFINQTTLSSIINSVENELGTTLFSRTHKGVSLTPDGNRAMPLMKEIVTKNTELYNTFNQDVLAGRSIHLIAYPCACYDLGLYLSQKIASTFKGVTLHIHETMYDKCISSIVDGVSPIAVGSDSSLNFDTDIVASKLKLKLEILYYDQFYLVVHKDSPYVKEKSVHIDNLYKEHLAIAPYYPLYDKSDMAMMFKKFAKHSMLPNNGVIKQAVAHNSMIAIMPGLAVYNDFYLNSGTLCRVKLEGFSTELSIYLAYKPTLIGPIEEYLMSEIRNYHKLLPSS